VRDDREPIAIASSGVARCAVTRETVGDLAGYPIYRTVLGAVEGLPDPAPDTRYIVSRTVAEACPDRDDLLIPDDTVRDEAGRIVACRGFATVARQTPTC
jgi:hypothetical protein